MITLADNPNIEEAVYSVVNNLTEVANPDQPIIVTAVVRMECKETSMFTEGTELVSHVAIITGDILGGLGQLLHNWLYTNFGDTVAMQSYSEILGDWSLNPSLEHREF